MRRLILLLLLAGLASPAVADPQPGDLYREFVWYSVDGEDWRVTDPAAVEKFPRASAFLPNPLRTIRVVDLEHATRAELMLDRWNGHRGSVNKRVRLNDGDWLSVPPVSGVSEDLRPAFLMTQDNPVIEVPLESLHEGDNTLEALCDEEGGFGWGQWGFFAAVLRVYYDRDAKGPDFAASGSVSVDGQTLMPETTVHVKASAPRGVTRVDVLAECLDYDFDGDGHWRGWQGHWHQPSRGEPPVLTNHVGSLRAEPYRLRWDTRWLPDQTRPVRLVARVRDSHGYWTVTPLLDGLTLPRRGVTLIRPLGMDEDFGVREDRVELSVTLPVPEGVTVDTAALHLRTWHGYAGHHEPLDLNGTALPVRGNEHFFDYDRLRLPQAVIREGENRLTFRSTTEHHQLEVLWPGPAIVIRPLDAVP